MNHRESVNTLFMMLLLSMRHLICLSVVVSVCYAYSHYSVGNRPRSREDISFECMDAFTSKQLNMLLFSDAMKEIRWNEKVDKDEVSRFAHRMFEYDWGAYTFHVNRTVVTYARVFKGNSENILRSYEIVNKSYEIYRNNMDHRSKYSGDTGNVFTFYRDPFSHWLSGMVESHWYHVFGTPPERWKATMADVHRVYNDSKVSKAMATVVLQNLISGKEKMLLHDISADVHLFCMSFSMIKWMPRFIGYLENFSDDWNLMQQKLNITIPYTLKWRQHYTSLDPFNMKKSILEVLHEKPGFLRAICRLLAKDYICLAYPLPPPCQGIISPSGQYVPFQSGHKN